jgi:branched-chain amino acid transport system permease protein
MRTAVMTDATAAKTERSEPRGDTVRNWTRKTTIPLAIIAAFFLPQLLGGSDVVYETLVLVAIFSVMAYGADFILSYLGEVSLGHTLFWAGGAYVTALVTTEQGWGPIAALVSSIVVTTVLAFLVGLFTLRTQEFVFSLVTYGSALIALTIVSNVAWLGGSDGLVGIPVLELPAIGGTYQAGTAYDLWPIAFGLLAVVVYLVSRFRRSTLGTRALMVHSNSNLARALGVDPGSVRLMVFTISAPVSAVAGWLYAYQRAYVSPDLFDPYFLLLMLTAVILAGRRQLLGPIVGTALIIFQQQMFSLGKYGDDLILGAILAVVLLVWPQGLGGIVESARRQALHRPRGCGRRPPPSDVLDSLPSSRVARAL